MSVRALAHTPIFGLKCPLRSVQYPDGRVLRGLYEKTAQKPLTAHTPDKQTQFLEDFWGKSIDQPDSVLMHLMSKHSC